MSNPAICFGCLQMLKGCACEQAGIARGDPLGTRLSKVMEVKDAELATLRQRVAELEEANSDYATKLRRMEQFADKAQARVAELEAAIREHRANATALDGEGEPWNGEPWDFEVALWAVLDKEAGRCDHDWAVTRFRDGAEEWECKKCGAEETHDER